MSARSIGSERRPEGEPYAETMANQDAHEPKNDHEAAPEYEVTEVAPGVLHVTDANTYPWSEYFYGASKESEQ